MNTGTNLSKANLFQTFLTLRYCARVCMYFAFLIFFVLSPAVHADEHRRISPIKLMHKHYSEAKILGIGSADHETFFAFKELFFLMQLVGQDPLLKYIAIEDSANRAALYEQASQVSVSDEEFVKRAKADFNQFTNQDAFLMVNFFPALRELNSRRANNPIIAVPVDSMKSEDLSEVETSRTSEVRFNNATLKLNPAFAASRQRESQTAAYFERLVLDRFREAKGIVIYQIAHLLKGATAVGVESDFAIRAPLSWMEFVMQSNPQLRENYRLVVVDNQSSQAPNGVLKLPSDFVRSSDFAFAIDWNAANATAKDLFTEGSFLSRYRGGSIELDTFHPPFDGVIVEPAIPH